MLDKLDQQPAHEQDFSLGPPELPALRSRGSNFSGIRQHNERVVLQAIRLRGPQSKAALARTTGLTAQAVSVITERLLQDGLLISNQAQRGKVGQPAVPLSLNPDGAFAFGVEVGRRRAQILLMDFAGQVRARRVFEYDFPEPQALLTFVYGGVDEFQALAMHDCGAGVVGVGLAAPLNLQGWQQLLHVAPQRIAAWQGLDFAQTLSLATSLEVIPVKDTAAACLAELVCGSGRHIANYLYIFIDTLVGGAVVINHRLHAGRTGNAGAVGSIALGLPGVAQNSLPQQLFSQASLIQLEEAYAAQGLDPHAVFDGRAMSEPCLPLTLAWIETTAAALALAAVNAACVLDFDAVVIDSTLDRQVLNCVIDRTISALACFNLEGIAPPTVLSGEIGAGARALGGALLPIYHRYAPDQDVFLK